MSPLDLSSTAVDVSFVLETDQAPEFWQFLNGLRGDDLIVELIVNDLDAHAPQTEVRFEPDRLICVGTGDPVDDEGWARLRKLKGAGHLVKAKDGLLGIKNHGLKACFTIGNDIHVRSAGRQILQTLFAHGPDAPAYPGVRVPPLDDPGAPAVGTQIEVPFRRQPFEAPQGEALPFGAVDDGAIGRVFQDAVDTLPERLLGVIRPGVLETYSLALSHHALGRRTFRFSCGRVRHEAGLAVFFRECREVSEDGADMLVAREQAVLSVWSPAGFEKKPRFFHSQNYRAAGHPVFAVAGLVVEASWPVDASGRLKSIAGRLRYPVAYPGSAEATLTGMGVHYSGPFISDTERHELGAQAKEWNDQLVAACDQTMARALAASLLRRHGAQALRLVADLKDPDRLRQFAQHLLRAKALPAVDREGAPCAISKKTRLVVPAYTYRKDCWSSDLAAVAPPGSAIVDPKTPSAFLSLLASGSCEGWNQDHLRYDEADVLARLQSPTADHFPWRSEAEWRRTLGQPASAAAHLDALLPVLDEKTTDRPQGDDVHLPDAEGRLHPLSKLKRGVSLPSGLIGLDLPPVIHSDLRDHAIFRFEGWRLQPYAFRDMLRDGDLASRSDAARKRFFTWLAKHPSAIAREDWPALKDLSVWPATNGSTQRFEDLCLLGSDVAALVGEHVLRPNRAVIRLCESVDNRRAHLNLRDSPRHDEIAAYVGAQFSRFPRDRTLDPGEQQRFIAFEADLVKLSRSHRVGRLLRTFAPQAVALNRLGWLRPAVSLVRESADVARLHLSDDVLLHRPSIELDRLFPPAPQPTPAMALTALRADTARTEALLPRLRLATANPEADTRAELQALACIPIEGRLRAPSELAFKGNQGDFWGDWKIVIGSAGLGDDAQDLYRAAGVIRSFPDPGTSRAFFVWLGGQPSGVAKRNLDCIIRHIGHKNGVGSWRLQPPEVACIPVEMGTDVGLITITEARRLAAIDDFPELAEAIRMTAPGFERKLAIHSVKTVSQPVAETLKDWGIPTLSSLARGPLAAKGDAPRDAPRGFLDAAHGLAATTAARRFKKQLQELDVPLTLLEPQFQRRLAAVRRVVVAGSLTAQFRVGRRVFAPMRPWAVLPDAIWLDAGGDLDDLLMHALADLVFVHPRPRYLPAILKAALSAGARDYRPADDTVPEVNDPDIENNDEDEDQDEDEDDAAEAVHRHPGGEPDPSRNQPRPGPLFGGGAGTRRTGPSGGRKQVIAEDIQRRQLKSEHYAHHCQMELALRPPDVLAPVGSYAEFAENRRKIMEAHHPDKVGAEGSRHAGNLLILSRVNHERLGTRLSRGDVTLALRGAWTPRTILNRDGSVWLKGGVAAAADPVTGETLPLFFSETHRAYWLDMANPAAGAG